MSSGVFIQCSKVSIPAMLRAVMITVTKRDKITALPILFFIPSLSPAPNLWAVSTVKPVVSPCVKPSIRKTTEPVAPTAANASRPTKRPTIMVSTIL